MRVTGSVVNKDMTLKAKAKDLTSRPRPRTSKDLRDLKDLTSKTRSRTALESYHTLPLLCKMRLKTAISIQFEL